MTDIAPELLNKIQSEFEEEYSKSRRIQKLLRVINNGKGSYAEANDYAIEVGEILADVFGRNISSSVLPDGVMYYNIAKRVVQLPLENNYNLISDVCRVVQDTINEAAGVGIAAQIPPFNTDRVDGIINRLTSEPDYDKVSWILKEPVVNFSQSVVDDSIEANASFAYTSGLNPTIKRTVVGGCCDWCKGLAGSYDYPLDDTDIYRRHERCRCTVEYIAGDGYKQNVWSKVKYRSIEAEEEKKNRLIDEQIELIKKYGSADKILLFGSYEDMQKYAELSKVTKLTEKDIINRLLKDTEQWDSMLSLQGGDLRKRLNNYALDNFNDEESSALRLWTSATYVDINRYMRYGINVNPIAKKGAKDIKEALSHSYTSEPMIVKRGISKRALNKWLSETPGVDGWEKNPQKLVGKSPVDKGFVATSPFEDGAFGGDVRLFISVPTGTRAAYIEMFSHAELEKELLIDSGYRYNILSVREDTNKLTGDKILKVYMEVAQK